MKTIAAVREKSETCEIGKWSKSGQSAVTTVTRGGKVVKTGSDNRGGGRRLTKEAGYC